MRKIYFDFFSSFFSKQGHEDINLHMITPSTQICIIKTTRYRIVKGIQRRSIMDSLYRDSFDLFIGIDPKVNPRNGGGHRTCEIRHSFPAAPGSTENTGEFFFLLFLGLALEERKGGFEKLTPRTFFCRATPPGSTFGLASPGSSLLIIDGDNNVLHLNRVCFSVHAVLRLTGYTSLISVFPPLRLSSVCYISGICG